MKAESISDNNLEILNLVVTHLWLHDGLDNSALWDIARVILPDIDVAIKKEEDLWDLVKMELVRRKPMSFGPQRTRVSSNSG